MVESSGTLRDADLRAGEVAQYAEVSRLAVVSLALALLGCLMVPIPIAFVLGVMAIKRIRQSKGALAGMPVAVAGVVVSVAMGLGWLLFFHLRAVDRRRAIDWSNEAVYQFFDWMERGYLDDAFNLLSTRGKKEYRQIMREWGNRLQQYGRLKGVHLEKVKWQNKNQAKLTYAINYADDSLRYEVTIEREGRQWRLRKFVLKGKPLRRPGQKKRT